MKLKSFLGVLAIAALFAGTSCKEGREANIMEANAFQDSLLARVPGARQVQARVDRDNMMDRPILTAIVYTPEFYDADGAKQESVANKTGEIADKVFGDGVYEGRLILTKEAGAHMKDPVDGKVLDMKIEGLRKARGK
jgi:hypothetical protein